MLNTPAIIVSSDSEWPPRISEYTAVTATDEDAVPVDLGTDAAGGDGPGALLEANTSVGSLEELLPPASDFEDAPDASASTPAASDRASSLPGRSRRAARKGAALATQVVETRGTCNASADGDERAARHLHLSAVVVQHEVGPAARRGLEAHLRSHFDAVRSTAMATVADGSQATQAGDHAAPPAVAGQIDWRAAAAAAAPAVGAAAAAAELRVDPEDGRTYDYRSFMEAYGHQAGHLRWTEAAAAPAHVRISPPRHQPNPGRAKQPERTSLGAAPAALVAVGGPAAREPGLERPGVHVPPGAQVLYEKAGTAMRYC